MVCCALQTQMSVWVCKHTHALARTERERERGLQFLMAVSRCRKFPLISSSPRPHILPPLFPCFFFFRSNSDDSEKQSWQVEASLEYVRPFAVSSGRPPLFYWRADRWYGLVRPAARSLTVCARCR